MSSYCRYIIPVFGNVSAETLPIFHVDDLFIEFGVVENEVVAISLIFPIRDATDEERAAHAGDSFWVHEPRAFEIEEIVLQIASGLSTFANTAVEMRFVDRRIEFFGEEGKSSITVDLGRRNNDEHAKQLSTTAVVRSVLTACVKRRHDPALTFYQRAVEDALAHRYIEAFYNFFFFLEYLYGNGKSGRRATVAEFSKSRELVKTIQKVMAEKHYAEIVSKDFLADLSNMAAEELIARIVEIRGLLHHPNKNRTGNWHPEKQRAYSSETIVLHFICSEIAVARYFTEAFSSSVQRAYKKAQHCIRRGSEIRVVTR